MAMFMRVEEVAEEVGISIPYAYKLICKLNKELEKNGCITITGRIDKKFFHEKFYCTRQQKKEENWTIVNKVDKQKSKIYRKFTSA